MPYRKATAESCPFHVSRKHKKCPPEIKFPERRTEGFVFRAGFGRGANIVMTKVVYFGDDSTLPSFNEKVPKAFQLDLSRAAEISVPTFYSRNTRKPNFYGPPGTSYFLNSSGPLLL